MSPVAQRLANIEFSLADLFYRLTCKPGLKLFRGLTRKLMFHAAELGHQPTLVVFGQRLVYSSVSVREQMLGAEYLLRAAQQGNPEAQWHAGQIYEQGLAQYAANDPNAVTWYARAGEQGHRLARQRLAKAYLQGELGLPVSEQKAQDWTE